MVFIKIYTPQLQKCASAPGQHKQSVPFYVPCHSQAALSLDKVERENNVFFAIIEL